MVAPKYAGCVDELSVLSGDRNLHSSEEAVTLCLASGIRKELCMRPMQYSRPKLYYRIKHISWIVFLEITRAALDAIC